MKKGRLLDLLVLAGVITLVALIYYQHRRTLDAIKVSVQEELNDHAKIKARELEQFFLSVYDGIRTISFLPGVRSITTNGALPDNNSKKTIQEIYNTVYENAKVSELYASATTLDPDRIDPRTKKPFAPLFTYDEFIVSGKEAGQTALTEEEKKGGIVEEELYEYRLMREQIRQLLAKVPPPGSDRRPQAPRPHRAGGDHLRQL